MTSPHLPKVAGIEPAVSSNSPTSPASSAPAESAASAAPAAPPTSPAPPTAVRATAVPGTAPPPPDPRSPQGHPQGDPPETNPGSPADRKRICDLSCLLDLTTRLARTDHFDAALRETLRAGGTLLGAPRGLVVLEPGTHPGAAHGPVPEQILGMGLGRAELGELETVPAPSPPAGAPGTDHEPGVACPDLAAAPDLGAQHRQVAARLGYSATYTVPLTTGSGARVGTAVWLYDEPGEPTVRQRELLGGYLRYATEHCAHLSELARMREESAALTAELLPSALPRLPGVTLAVRHRTSPSGGGDWFDALALPDRAVGLAVGSVTGSGPAAVAAMGRLRASLRAYAVMEGEDPVAVLSDLELLLRLTEPAASATALFAYAEPAARKVLLAGAGHCAPLIVGPRRVEPVETAVSAPLGMLACWEAPSAEVVLGEGETLLCYTDGLLHRTGQSMDRAFARLRSAAAGAPRATREDPEALVDHVLRTVLPAPLADLPDHPEDVVLLAARF
ncbi:PP2C family protein-serine/threonine phosphatase [Streptomyces reniochalinae]|uniref:Serine/threonine-protein phosphatase n=1 Tax=Streptomyces reniochalinae TaxID=2250578 RepID=A0A367EH29_9ACTN|nr:PP2C family protein-serine/threonine phosphatase [Streptomyces reniochalinae]RCG17012.1 serine/threonine-protein phosphatase [Streptomyces reniochalinae]